jgi:Fur family ferric uptake transcriptional regulator
MKNKSSYKTKQREILLDCLRNHKDQHINVEQVLEHCKQAGSSVGQTTIYRYLEKLVQEGVVVKYAAADGMSSCFQYSEQAGSCQKHYHLICIDCGQMVHLQCDYLDDLSVHIQKEHQFVLDSFKTVLYGHCQTCMTTR